MLAAKPVTVAGLIAQCMHYLEFETSQQRRRRVEQPEKAAVAVYPLQDTFSADVFLAFCYISFYILARCN